MLIATEATIATARRLVEAVGRASIKGWQQYLADPEATNRHINSLNPEMGLDILAYGAKESGALVLDPVAQKAGIGHMSAARWLDLLDQMVAAALIDEGTVDANAAFTDHFLP